MDASTAELAGSWVLCAKQGEHCAFKDTRRVRYGAGKRFIVKTFSDGVHCDSREFAAWRRRNATCSFEASAATSSTPPVTGSSGAVAPEPTAGTHAGHTTAGTHAGHTTAGTHAGHTTAGAGGTGGTAAVTTAGTHGAHTAGGTGGTAAVTTAGTGADHGAHTAAGSMAGPYIDLSAIPTGDPGSGTADLGTTSEKPSASGDGIGAFRTVCGYSHMLSDDPIVFPGQPGKSHLHAFFGNVDADAYSTQSSIRDSGNSTCRGGTANRSAYWVPALIDAAGKPIEPEGMDVYYKSGYNGIAPSQIQKFPSGLRVIAGSAKASSAQAHAYWGCRENYIGHPATIPQCSSGDNLMMFVEFPQCWDGKNLDSADHVSHMSYTVNGKCPSTHPVAIPAITFNVLYPVRDVKGWRLASDMYSTSQPGGFSAHADWFEGWDPEVSESFVENCVARGVDCHSHLVGDGRTID